MSQSPGPDAEHGERQGVPRRRAQRSRKHTLGVVLLSTVVVLALVTGLSVAYLYRHLNGNLNVQDVSAALGEDRPTKVVEGEQQPINVLVMGSDTRQGEGNALDQESGANASDTTILLHLSADRERAYGISIPRDSIVERPDCGANDQIPGDRTAMWNKAFTVGGQACTIRQFEELSGVYVDNYVVVDFNGFKDMVNAIDGVDVCIPEDINDPAHGINLEAGTRTLRGDDALNYVRARYTLGDGSDLGRMKRQQAFIASMVNKVVSAGTLTRVDRLVGFLDAATESLTVDPGLENVGRLGQLGMQLQGIGLDEIQFLTIPNEYYPESSEFSGRVRLTRQGDRIWRKIRRDKALPERFLDTAISAAAPPGQEKGKKGNDTKDKGNGKGNGKGNRSGSNAESEVSAEAAAAAGLCT